MKIAITVGQTKDGKWVDICAPDVSVSKQKDTIKSLKASGGKLGKVELVNAYMFTNAGYCKRAKFDGVKSAKVVEGVKSDKSAAERATAYIKQLAEKIVPQKSGSPAVPAAIRAKKQMAAKVAIEAPKAEKAK